MRNPTIKDVAERAGVGIGTVSRVINQSAQVRPETRERVLAAIEELKYSPNTAARQLSGGKTWSVGVISPFFTTPSFVERLNGIQHMLDDTGYDLILYSIRSVEQLKHRLQEIGTQNRVDGLIVLAISICADELFQHNPDLPAVFVVEEMVAEYPCIMVDNLMGGRIATEFMIERDHALIGFVGDTPPINFQHVPPTQQRFEGFQKAMSDNGLPIVEEWCKFGDYSQQGAFEVATEMLSKTDHPTAIVASNDTMAFGVLEAAKKLGLRVPQDLAVIGFDDIPASYNAALTTVKQQLFEGGYMGASQLLGWLNDGEVPNSETYLPLEIIHRETA